MRSVKFFIMLFCAGLLVAVPQLASSGGAIALNDKVEAYQPILTLAEMLPRSSDAAVRAQAASIAFGLAPDPGAIRHLTRAEIVTRLSSAAPDLIQELSIPPQVTVTRFSRAITRVELLAAIQSALKQQGDEDANAIHTDNLDYALPIYVTTDDPGLQVTGIGFDSRRRETWFRIRAAKDPALVPFAVYLQGNIELPVLVARREIAAGQRVSTEDFQMASRKVEGEWFGSRMTAAQVAGLSARQTIHAGEPINRSMFAAVMLVRSGHPAALILQGARFRATITVTPMQSGAMGQIVRAHGADPRNLYKGKVVGPDELYAVM